MFNFLLISLATLSVGSDFPVKYLLTLEVLMFKISENFRKFYLRNIYFKHSQFYKFL